MVGDPIVSNPGGHDHDILHLPRYRQPQAAPECILYSLWITSHYVANSYPDKNIRDKTNPPKLDTIKDHIQVGKLGWETPSQAPLTELSSETSSINFNLEYGYNGIPKRVDEFVQPGLDQLLPTIIWVDHSLMKTGERRHGPMHAVVVAGVGESQISIEDPLVEGTTTLEIEKLEEAWDSEYNTAIEIGLRDGLDPIRRDEL